MRVQLTVRVEPHTADYIAAVREHNRRATGVRMSIGQVAAVLLERAEAEGWTVTTAPPQTSRPGSLNPPQPGRDLTPTRPESET